MHLPELFGPYLLHRLLARGTTSDVYLAQTVGDFPRVCAIKVVRPEVAVLPGFAHRFRSDAALLVRLIHGNLVQVLEVGAAEERLFVAMELIDGVDLTELIDQSQEPLPPELALYIGLEMCEAATYIQLHRREATGSASFSPDAPWPLEVMVSFDGVVKVVDLGSFGAIHLGQQRVSKLFQSPGYAVPEVVLKRPLDQRSDLFAIGLVLWELLQGRRLVSGDPERYVRQVLDGSWKAPLVRRKDLSGDVARLVASLLSLDPSQRPQSVEVVRSRLVAGLRRVAPAYGSSSVARLLWHRCQHLIHKTEEMVSEVIRSSSTDKDFPTGIPTKSFGHVSEVDRQVGTPAPLNPGDPVPGTRYRVVRQVGQGGSAQVFAAQHIDLDRQVAIKVLSSQLAGNSAAIAQFRMEARACSRVGHANIVDVIDFGELEDGRFFFAMELLDGQSLADLLDTEGKIPVARAIGIFRQIAKALHATHKHGIVHRDLKPENVMLVARDGREDVVKLLDFGVMAFGTQAPGRAVGTSGYMAPEQVRGAHPTPAMDIYALGATVYESLAGVAPYPGETYEEFCQLQATSPPPALRSHPGARQLPEGLERVVHRALERDPGVRHPSMADFEADLIKAQREAGLQTPWDDLADPFAEQVDRRSGKLRAVRPERSSPRLWIVAFGVTLAAVAVLAVAQLSTTEPTEPRRRAAARAAQPPQARPLSAAMQALLRRAEQAASEGRFTHPAESSALDLLKRVEREAPGDRHAAALRSQIAHLLEGAGDRLVGAGMKESARTLFREALLFTPESLRLVRLAELDAMQQQGASGRAGRRPEARVAEVAWLLSQVQLAVMEGRYISPPKRNALQLLVRLKQVDPSGRRLAEAQQKMTRTLLDRAQQLWQGGKQDQARPLYQLVVLLDAKDALARRRSRAPDAGAGQPTGATTAKGPARTPSPDKERVDAEQARRLVAQGQRLLRIGKLEQAQSRFRQAVEANPNDSSGYAGLATVAFERASYSRSVELARQVVQMNPRGVQGHILLGDAYFKLMRYNAAREAWEHVLKLDPQNARASRRIERLKQTVN